MPNRIHRLPTLAFAIALALVLGAGVRSDDSASDDEGTGAATVSFSRQILPILEARCTECHGGPKPELGLVLATWEGAMAGSEYGPVIEPGDPEASLIVKMIANGDMPDEGEPVPPDELELLRAWIREGAGNN
jgi:hypothetical protein